ncbi:phosphatase PAP2 family protein [Solihabitans fulvus]|uniref:Phosphatase PAP2 family protein n=1 Tax=Solihabitans fulvus TaxID=1892852 RepID=A0A5B2WXR4_9PSEU|nr:phosphatase PAP2 family protein [Solihabitans fulvus]KAA2255482.1 phosphatase PAP2 family protein [Solihabitans fulvus]
MTFFDDSWYTAITRFASDTPWLQGPMTAFTNYGVVLFAALMLAAAWTARRGSTATMTMALAAPVGFVLAYGVSNVVKLVITEPRPCQAMHVTTVLPCDPPADYSFPSNHAALAGAAAIGVLLVHRWLGAVAVVAAVVMAYSRVFVGAHYPHDALAGLVIGAVVGWLTCVTARRMLTSQVDRLRSGPLRSLLVASDVEGRTPRRSPR